MAVTTNLATECLDLLIVGTEVHNRVLAGFIVPPFHVLLVFPELPVSAEVNEDALGHETPISFLFSTLVAF